MIGGVRCCPRCLTGGHKGRGGKHDAHDRLAADCILHGSEAQGGAARKLIVEVAESHVWEDGTRTILEPHRGRK